MNPRSTKNTIYNETGFTHDICYPPPYVKTLLGSLSQLSASILLLLAAMMMTHQLAAQNYCYFADSKDTDILTNPAAATIEPLPEILRINERIVQTTDANDNLYLAIPEFNETTIAFQMAVRRFNATGTEIWSNIYQIPEANGNVIPAAIQTDPSGNLLVAGTFQAGTANNYDAYIMKLNPQGNLLWKKIYAGAANSFDGWFSLATDDNGRIFVGGATTPQGLTPDFSTMGLAANGDELWLRQKNVFGQIDLAAQIECVNGVVFASGATQQNANTWGLLNASYAAADGNILFETPVQAGGNELYQIEKLVADTANDLIYVVATHQKTTGSEFYVAKINTLTGELVWESNNPTTGSFETRARSGDIDGSENVYIVGYKKQQNLGRDVALEKYNSVGQLQWTKYFDSNGLDDEAFDVKLDNAGSVYLTGYGIDETNNKSFLTLKADTDGTELWRKYYNGTYNDDDIAQSIQLDEDNNVLVSGATKRGDNTSFTTVKYRNDCTVELPETGGISSRINFIENRGQLIDTDGESIKDVQFSSEGTSPKQYYGNNQVSMVFAEYDEVTEQIASLHRVDMNLVGGDGRNQGVYGLEKKSHHYNYYIGSGARHRERVGLFHNIVQSNTWNNIDVQYAGKSGGLAYNYIIKPGGNPADIKMSFAGQDNLQILAAGDLEIETGIGKTTIPKPHAYQLDDYGNEVAVNWTPAFSQSGNVVGFTTGIYDDTKVLVIECRKTTPTVTNSVVNGNLTYSTHFGEMNGDEIFDIKTNGTGVVDMALTGSTSSPDFPADIGGFSDNTFGAGLDAFVTKTNELGQIKWSTFVGGSTSNQNVSSVGSDAGTAITFDLNNNIYMAGTTTSNDIGIEASGSQYVDLTSINSSTFGQLSYPIGNAFIAQFNGTSGQTLWKTYYGGNNFVNPKGAVVNSDNHLVLVCEFDDQSETVPPVVNNPSNDFYVESEGLINIIEFNIGQAIHWNTRYGPKTSDEIGNSDFAVGDVDLDNEDNLLIVGKWAHSYGNAAIVSDQFVNLGGGNYYENEYIFDLYNGTILEDAYIFKMVNRKPFYGTFFGGETYDEALSVSHDVNNNIYISGFTDSGGEYGTTFPLKEPPFAGGYFNSEFGGGYLAKFSPVGNQLWTTYVGLGSDFVLFDLEVSLKGLIVVTGTVAGVNQEFIIEDSDAYNQSTANQPEPGQPSPSSAVDVIIATFNPDYSQNWGTLVGGIGGEEGRKMSISEDNKLCLTGVVNNFSNGTPHYPTEDPLPSDDTNYFEPASFGNSKDAFISVFALDGVEVPTSSNEVDLLSENITIFPNPATSVIHYDIENSTIDKLSTITVIDAFGKIVGEYQQTLSANQKINVKALPAGIYFLRIATDNQIFSQKFIKQ